MPSTVIRAFSYDPIKHELTITFVSGRVYTYRRVPPDVAAALRTASSRGEFFNARIRGAYPFSEMLRSA